MREMRADRAEMRVRAGAREDWTPRVEARSVRVRRETCVVSYIHVSARGERSQARPFWVCVHKIASSSSAGGTDKATVYDQHP